MTAKIKLLPLTILLMFFALIVRIPETLSDGQMIYKSALISDSYAAEEDSKEEKSDAKTDTEADEHSNDAKDADKKVDTKESKEATTNTVSDAPPPQNVGATLDGCKLYTQTEMDLLQGLSKRREELADKSKKIDEKEIMLKAAEDKLQKKALELSSIKTDVEKLLGLYDQHEEAKIRSLIKIYENMKPKDAAVIFEKLEMPILLKVVEKMNEKKLSLILASMNPDKAKSVTVELASEKQLPSQGTIQNAKAASTLPELPNQPAPR